jgi:hypothetical protein
MSPKIRLRHRMSVLLHMATAFIIIILLAQFWLFTVTIDGAAGTVAVACSLIATLAICGLIRLFLRVESQQ